MHVRSRRAEDVPGFGAHRVSGNVVNSVMICTDEISVFYVNVRVDARTLPAIIRKAMSGMYSVVDGYDFSDFDGSRYLRREFEVDRRMIAHCGHVSPPSAGEFPRARVTAEHHTHYRPEEVWDVAMHFKARMTPLALVLKALRRMEGVTEAMVATFLMYVLFARPQVAQIFSTSRKIWNCNTVDELLVVLKKLSTPLKSMHNRDVLDLTEMFELMCLVNRGVGTIDWDAERLHRVRPDVIKVDPADVYREAQSVFLDGVRRGYRYSRMDLNKYLDARWEWVPSGSIHSQYPEDKPYMKKQYRHRTKFVALNMMSKQHIASMFKRPPEIHAWASVKHEWAKQRAIYGVDLTDTVITNYAMFRCEEVFKHKFPIGEEAAAERVHKRLKFLLQDSESLCYDFDDFNAQHSTASMKAVLEAYYDTFCCDMDVSQQRAMEWVIASIDKVVVHNNENGRNEQYEAEGTLLSGWRLTTFMNTALNYIYFKIAGVFDLPGVIDSVHNGDDVLVSIRDVHTANSIHAQMAKINARAQHAKCNVFSVGEFLRVEHKVDKDKGLGAQYLTRGVATLVHSRTESQEPTRLIDSLKAAVTRCEEVVARSKDSMDVGLTLLDMVVQRLSKLFGVDVDVCRRLVRAHVIVGGPIAGMEGKVDKHYKEGIDYETTEGLSSTELRKLATVQELGPGIYDYARLLVKQFGRYIGEDQALRSVQEATRRQLAITRRTWLTETDVSMDRKYEYGKTVFRMYRELVNIPHLEKARFVGVSPISLLAEANMKLITNLIASSVDVNYTLKVLL